MAEFGAAGAGLRDEDRRALKEGKKLLKKALGAAGVLKGGKHKEKLRREKERRRDRAVSAPPFSWCEWRGFIIGAFTRGHRRARSAPAYVGRFRPVAAAPRLPPPSLRNVPLWIP